MTSRNPFHNRRRLLAAVACATACAVTAISAWAQPFPNRPVSIVVPFAPGGTAELAGRMMAQEMQTLLGASVVVDLKPGAGGNIGAEFVARQSRPDGYTLLLGSSSLASNMSLMKLAFDPLKDLVAVAGIGMVPNILVVGPDFSGKTALEAITLAKAKPGGLTFGSSGPGTSSHLSGELFKSVIGADIVHVPYKGSGAVYPDLIAGRVDLLFDLQGSALAQIKGGRVRALATTAARRSSALPEVPTVAELGYPGYENGAWLGLMAPVGTPKEVLARLEDAAEKALRSAGAVQRLEQMAAEPIPVRGAEFGRYIQSDAQRWEKLVKEGKLKPLQ